MQGSQSLSLILESFLRGRELTPHELSLLTPEMILGVNELEKIEYTKEQRKAIELALYQFGQCKGENLKGVAEAWINEFEELRMPHFEVIKRIRLAKTEKKYGITEFAIFMNVNLSDYSDFYKHVKKEIQQ